MDLICHTCGKSFKNFPSNIKKNKNTYCSQKCHYDKRSENNLSNCVLCTISLDPKRRGFYKDYCKNCYNRERLKNNPEIKEKVQTSQRNFHRIKIGHAVNNTLMRAKNGSGSFGSGYKYFYKPEHPNSSKDGKVAEHVLVMSKFLDRPMHKGETIHHKNGIRHDNRIENLELWSKKHPPGQRIYDQIKWAIELLEKYGHTVILNSVSYIT